ncbi:MAG: hypothetical protein UT66_C0061G0004 [candidate division CPR2 bacterium GW2011_GWC1_39_9]|uniref:Uncharacterized protein n=1 Tax=candidate division CPR2 bacterium GW2011_GWC2_39_10 TaxID=1618345 RepID=A0A0G0PZP0_UNCC2|nr:MAG: hypothetical protein UT18_C0006G0004 [candidate division CPR2 bacterium GW2011_GWC2_39_10]KKR32574.1 MAG: hypothetical protein UT66_C0061G0004 [candidate division CPR2 bacterium GW2011_GWC1_39_9]
MKKNDIILEDLSAMMVKGFGDIAEKFEERDKQIKDIMAAIQSSSIETHALIKATNTRINEKDKEFQEIRSDIRNFKDEILTVLDGHTSILMRLD